MEVQSSRALDVGCQWTTTFTVNFIPEFFLSDACECLARVPTFAIAIVLHENLFGIAVGLLDCATTPALQMALYLRFGTVGRCGIVTFAEHDGKHRYIEHFHLHWQALHVGIHARSIAAFDLEASWDGDDISLMGGGYLYHLFPRIVGL